MDLSQSYLGSEICSGAKESREEECYERGTSSENPSRVVSLYNWPTCKLAEFNKLNF